MSVVVRRPSPEFLCAYGMPPTTLRSRPVPALPDQRQGCGTAAQLQFQVPPRAHLGGGALCDRAADSPTRPRYHGDLPLEAHCASAPTREHRWRPRIDNSMPGAREDVPRTARGAYAPRPHHPSRATCYEPGVKEIRRRSMSPIVLYSSSIRTAPVPGTSHVVIRYADRVK